MNDLPQQLDAERATLGSVFLNRDAIVAVAPWLAADMFYLERHAHIYAAMLALYERRVPPDVRTVAGELKRREQLDAVGGIAYLASLSDEVPTASHVEHYARLVERAALGRRAIALGSDIAKLGYQDALSSEELRAAVQAPVTSFVTSGQRAEFSRLGDVLWDVLNDMNADKSDAIPTGLIDYDHLTGGLWPGHLVVPAGRPGHGKSSFVMTVAMNVARAGHQVVLFTLEMERKEIAQRILSAEAELDGMRIRQAELNDGELTRAAEAISRADSWPLWLEDARVSVDDVRARVLRHIAEHGPVALVIVDYIQIMRTAGRRGQSRQQEIGEITRGLKALATEAHCTVMAPSQLNREIEHRGEKVPTLADLREAGDIENDANQVVFVVRPELLDASTRATNVGMLYVAKHRGGRTGKVELRFNGTLTRFENLAKYRDDE